MSRSAGTGSPVWFRCHLDRRGVGVDHRIQLTGNRRPNRAKPGHALGSRSTFVSRQYVCSCGHRGWSNHVDLARLAGEDRMAEA